MILICGRHNILVMRSLVMKIEIPCTIDFMCFMLNQTMDYRNSLTKCCMGISFKVTKWKGSIVWTHATSRLATQCWNLSLWLNKILPLPYRLIIILFLSFSNYVSILVPPSTSVCSIVPFRLFLTSMLFFLPLIYWLLLSFFWTFFFGCIYQFFCTWGVIWEEWKKRKCKRWNGRKGPTFILNWPVELIP
jgi:hypothetical protein